METHSDETFDFSKNVYFEAILPKAPVQGIGEGFQPVS
jgi:hypothetical protein